MIWTPATLPPHPSSIPTLSPLAQSVLGLIRQEREREEYVSRNNSYGNTTSGSVHAHLQNTIDKNVQERRHVLSDATNGVIDFQVSAGMNSLASVPIIHSRHGNLTTRRDTVTFPPPSQEGLHIKTSAAESGRTLFNTHPWTNTYFQQREHCSRNYQTQLTQNKEQSNNVKETQFCLNVFEPLGGNRENHSEIKQPFNLSPDMEFDDMKVYSCPFSRSNEENIVKLKNDSKISIKVPEAASTTNSLNFKEIKRRPLQSCVLNTNNNMQSLNPTENHKKRIISNNSKLSDQTFVFANANAVPKFKKKLSKLKTKSDRTVDPNKLLIHKTKEDENTIHDKSMRNFNESLSKNVCEMYLGSMNPREENFYLDDVFDNAITKSGQENRERKSLRENRITTQKTERNFTRLADMDGMYVTTKSPKYPGGNKIPLDKNTNRKIKTEQLKKQSTMNSPTDDLSFNQQSVLCENLFVKTRESDCVNNYENSVSQKSESKVVSPLLNQQNVKIDCFDFNQISDFSQNLFVKTQESVKEPEHSQNRTNENEDTEDYSFPPYQKPAFESTESPNFNVDDLFSLQDESLQTSLSAIKEKNYNESQEKTKMLKCKDEEENYFRQTNSGLESHNVNENSLINSGEKVKSRENNSHVNCDQIKRKFINEGDLPINKRKLSDNADGVLPIKSIYFQAPTENDRPLNSKSRKISVSDTVIDKNGFTSSNEESIEDSRSRGNSNSMSVNAINLGKNGKEIMEVDIEINGKNLAKSLIKDTPLKQTTLFDCTSFHQETKKRNHDHESKPSQLIQEPAKVAGFKKPLPPSKKPKAKTSPMTQNVKKSKAFPSPILNDHSSSTKSKIKNEFLQSNTSMQEIKQKCDPTKLVQSSLLKNEVAGRSTSLTSKPKKSKKPTFIPPIAASHSTSKEAALKNYTITVIDDVSANVILHRANSEELTKVVSTVSFKEGYTLLNKPEEQKKNSRCFPSGVMFLIFWGTGRFEYCWLPLLDTSSITPTVVKLVDTLMSKSERNICFEAQAVYMLLMDVLNHRNISDWNAYDPLIGCWLLDPDNPPKDFQEVTNKLQIDRNLLTVNPQADTKTQACDLLPVLDVAMNILQNRLVNTSLWTVFSDMETKLIPILADMESSSILVDVQKLHRTAEAMEKQLRRLQSEAHGLADRWFLLNSPQQLREILYDKLKLDEMFNLKIKKTEHGEKSTSETVLEQMKEHHPLPKIILEYRHLQKLKSTYVDGLIQHLKSDGTVSTSWEQVSAATGRITSKNPNLQAFPKCPIDVQGGETIHMREMFKAREGCSFLAADFQQIEFRVFAHFTQDKSLLQAFRDGGDIFQRLAELWLGGKGEEEREKTKRIVYSVMYGAGANKLSEYLRVEPSEARKIIDNFVAIFPSLRSLPKTVITQCRAQGFVVTLSGRRRLFPHIRSTNGKLRSYSERQAMNFLIQGSAADLCKAAMLDCEAELRSRGLRAKLLLMIHDELVWEVDDRDLQETSKTVKEAMERKWNERLSLLVPIPVCVSTGKTLANMKSLVE